MDVILKAIEDIIYFYEESPTAKRYKLTKDEYLYMYSVARSYDMLALSDYYDRNRSYVYKVRKRLLDKFGVNTVNEVMYRFGQLDGGKP